MGEYVGVGLVIESSSSNKGNTRNPSGFEVCLMSKSGAAVFGDDDLDKAFVGVLERDGSGA